MLKLCVILFFLSLSCWASEEEGADQGRPASCYTKLIEGLKAEIVEQVPVLSEQVALLRADLKAVNDQETLSGRDWDAVSNRIQSMEESVRGLRWAPSELPDHFLTSAHLTVREASHDLKNALLVAHLDAAEMRLAATETERRLILKSIEVNLELAQECMATIANPISSPKRLFSVRELFQDLEILLQGLPNKVVLTTVRPEVGIAVRASRTQILRLVQNLVLNAAEAMGSRGGQITLSAEVTLPPVDRHEELVAESIVEVRQGVLVPQNPYVSIRVSDNGPGMEKRKLASIFAGASTRSSDGGVNPRGVGLSSVTSLALANNGFIEADSELGRGTRIQAIFPLVNREMTEQMAQEINVPSVPGQVVVIDDQKSIRHVVTAVLKNSGIPVVAFSNSLSALEFCRRHKEDVRLILLDQHLNDGSSMESNVEDILAEGITAPIVASSGSETPQSVSLAASIGKPFVANAFIELLEKLAPLPPSPGSP